MEMSPLPPAARLDRMIVEVETSLTPLLVSIDLSARAGRETARMRNLLACLERHLTLLYRNREVLLRQPEPL
jgi:hypothetical protein